MLLWLSIVKEMFKKLICEYYYEIAYKNKLPRYFIVNNVEYTAQLEL